MQISDHFLIELHRCTTAISITSMAKVLETNTDFPIKSNQPVHFGKVRAVYWLTKNDSARLIKEKGYDVAADSDLAVMVISDKISAYGIVWKGEGGMHLAGG